MHCSSIVPKWTARIAAFAATLALAGCAQYASVSKRQPQFRPIKAATVSMARVEQNITAAMKRDKREPLVALGELLTAAQVASEQLTRSPGDIAVRDAYNFAVARAFGTIEQAKLDPWTKPLRIPAAGGDYILTRKADRRRAWNPALYDFTPADQFDVKGTYVSEEVRKSGLGAPLVAVGRTENVNAAADYLTPRTVYGITAVIRFEGRRAVIGFEDPLAKEEVTMGGHRFPLAANYTVPLAVMLASTDTSSLELARLLRPEKYAETARITRLQPYDPDKTVVLVIHGLKDSPATWTPMINHLRADEQIRRNYQFWFYSYPSGYPYPYSAAILRRELDAIEKRFPLRKKMVVVGHSMGGCISRLLITDTGETLWRELFKRPPAEVELSPESRKLFTEGLIFRHRPEVGRVIFIAAPLRGSDLASTLPGRIGSMLVKSPATLITAGRDALKVVSFQNDELRLKRIPNSVDTLAPNNRFVRAIQTIPLNPSIPHHVISGDRGKGGNKDKTPPVMSDGIVPYWSSHMDTASSELVVPSSHSAHQNPRAMEEVKRILGLHANVRTSSSSQALGTR